VTIISIVQPKHGQGCSTTTAGLAVAATSMSSSTVLLVEPSTGDSDLPAILGMSTPTVGTVTRVTDRLDFMYGITPDTLPALATYDLVFIDHGTDLTTPPGLVDFTFQVIQPAYLTLRRGVAVTPAVPFILVELPHCALDVRDCERALGAKCLTTLPFAPHIARLVDAGLLAGRPPQEFTSAWLAIFEQFVPA